MRWIAIAATVDNEVIIADDDVVKLQIITEHDFQTIVKIYGVTTGEYESLKSECYDFTIIYKNLRSTWLKPCNRTLRTQTLSQIYKARLKALANIKSRLEHALNKHRTITTQQIDVYHAKVIESKDILSNKLSDFRQDGFVFDFAQERGLDIDTAATLVLLKHDGWYQHLRHVERLRLRYFEAVKRAQTTRDFEKISADLDKDMFVNILL